MIADKAAVTKSYTATASKPGNSQLPTRRTTYTIIYRPMHLDCNCDHEPLPIETATTHIHYSIIMPGFTGQSATRQPQP